MAMADQDDDEEQDLAPNYRGIKRDHQMLNDALPFVIANWRTW
jgi:hypothetical protein